MHGSRCTLAFPRELEIIVDLRKQVKETAIHVKTLSDRVNRKGFTPRAEKTMAIRPGNKGFRTGARALCPKGGIVRRACPTRRAANDAGAVGAHAFAAEDVENDFYAVQFQHAIDSGDTDRFRALCLLAGGKPEIVSDFSACSLFGVGEDVDDGVGEGIDDGVGVYRQYCQPVDTSMGGFHMIGVVLRMVSPPTNDGQMHPVSALHVGRGDRCSACMRTAALGSALHAGPAHEPDLTFADRIAQLGGLWVTGERQAFALNHMHAEDDEDGSVVQGRYQGHLSGTSYPPARGCGKLPLGLGRSAAISLLVCALLCVCATAAPITTAAFGGVGMGTRTAPPIEMGNVLSSCLDVS
ncbi:hypothetical protein CYMTET_18681 [Cymbomonas tetramitiformis]|uniref:Uncharacterized protein n=1 Tax=Cymbomonas tetramitiformis TaxID=36881 RepID=A0AAE0G7K7_9CHLO|nr:hypothetical protein CYMTET_18681 [Cymbomonas tetramitiformis]